MSGQMTTSDKLSVSSAATPWEASLGDTAPGGSVTPFRLAPQQRLSLSELGKGLPPWLAPRQTLRAVAQELAETLGVAVGIVGRRASAWEILAESREESSTLGTRTNTGSGFAEAVDWLGKRAGARWNQEGREHTLVALPVPNAPGPVVLVIEGDWMTSAFDLAECAASLVMVPSRGKVSAVNAPDHLARQLTTASTLAEACDVLLRYAVAVVPCRYASAAAPDAEGTLQIVAAHGYPVAIMAPVRIEPGRGVIGAVYERARPLLVRDVDALHGVSQPRPRFRTKSCAAIPVTAGGVVLAVLSVADREGDGAFTSADVDRLSALAAPAALALARVRTELHARDLAQAAIVDSGSGLFNRLYFQSRIQEELQRATRQGTPLALQIIDVDAFKAVNDRFGHLAGDAIIKDVADILRRSVRVFDVCARYGGDEFAVVMPGSRVDTAAAIADRIRILIEQRQPRLPNDPSITVSVGVAELQPGDDARMMIERADRALYQAKRAGKNRVVPSPQPARLAIEPPPSPAAR